MSKLSHLTHNGLSTITFIPELQVNYHNAFCITDTNYASLPHEEISAYGNREIIKDRLHTVSKVYSCGAGGDDLLMYGNLSMSLCNGTKVETGFCARCVVAMEVAEGPKIKYWQAWFVSGTDEFLKCWNGA